MESNLRTCGHQGLLSFCANHELAVCAECYFSEHKGCSDSMLLKEACQEFIRKFEAIKNQAEENRTNCSSMQKRVSEQVDLEDEIMKKVEQQYDALKMIIDEQKEHATQIIKNLESV